MRARYALVGSAALLGTLLLVISLSAYALTPSRGLPSTSVITVKTTSNTLNQTDVIINLKLPNGTTFTGGIAQIGRYRANVTGGSYVFQDVAPGTYSLNFTAAPNFFVPPFTMKLAPGVKNLVNETIYPLEHFVLIETSGLKYNGTQPGPRLNVPNGSAVSVEIFNNTTQINDFAVVRNLSNSNQSNIMFNSLSDSLSPGGSARITFIVNETGYFYYTSLIGSQSKDGQYGYLISL